MIHARLFTQITIPATIGLPTQVAGYASAYLRMDSRAPAIGNTPAYAAHMDAAAYAARVSR